MTRRTQLEELQTRFATIHQAEFYLSTAGEDFKVIKQRHDNYIDALNNVRRAVPKGMKLATVERSLVPQFDFQNDLVLAVGQDGLVSNVAKYLSGQPLVGINPDPAVFQGTLLPWAVGDAGLVMDLVFANRARAQHVTMARATTSNGHEMFAFNDFFIGQAGHASALYELSYNGESEFQSSSGVIVSTGAGSTGWMKSIQSNALNLTHTVQSPFPILGRESEELVFAVREPWPSKTTGNAINFGLIKQNAPLIIHSRMATGGVIFGDGIEWDFVEFSSGTHVVIQAAAQKVNLVVP